MPSIKEKIVERLTLAMKIRDQPRKDIFRFLKGKLDQMEQPTDEAATRLIRSLLKDADANTGMFTVLEVQEMNDLVPALLDYNQTLALLSDDVREAVRNAKAEGQAMGVVMKTLKEQPVDSQVVKDIVTHLRAEVNLASSRSV